MNSILWDGGDEIWNNDGSKVTVAYSDVQGTWPGEGNIDADPLFTKRWGANYRLTLGSPCLDAGDPAYVPAPNETDFASYCRLIGRSIDMGVYEVQPEIEVSVNRFDFEATTGFPDPPEQLLIVRNAGAGKLDWQIDCDCDWLHVDPNVGTSKGEGNTAYLQVDKSGLADGQYDCDLTVRAPRAVNNPQTVRVHLVLELDCFPHAPEYRQQYLAFLEYAARGKDPSCWCASAVDGTRYQCYGDASGTHQKFTWYRVYTDDLALVINNWKKRIDAADPCADIDHRSYGLHGYRVFVNDLAVLVANWKKRDTELPNDCPRPDEIER